MKKFTRFLRIASRYAPSLLGLLVFASPVNAQHIEWINPIGGNGQDEVNAVVVDTSGNVHVAGYFSNTADFNPRGTIASINSYGSFDMYSAKYDNKGNLIWVVGMGGTNQDKADAIAVDAAGNTYITGFFAGTIDFDPSPAVANLATPNSSIAYRFFAKYDVSGKYVWAKKIDNISTGSVQPAKIKVDGAGNVYLAGCFQDMVDLDPGPGSSFLSTSSMFDQDGYIAKYDNNGDFIWAKNIKGEGADYIRDIKIDGKSLYVTGHFEDNVNFDMGGGLVVKNCGMGSIVLAKYDTAGNYIWANVFLGATGSTNYGTSIAVDTGRNVYLTGYFKGVMDFNPSTTVSNLTALSTNNDIFLAKYDSAGRYLSAFNIGAAGSNSGAGRAVDVDQSGFVYLSGETFATLDFDPGTGVANLPNNTGSTQGFVAKYDPAGNYLWALSTGFRSYSVAYSGTDVYTCGSFNNTSDSFAVDTLQTYANSTDGHLLKIVCSDTSSMRVDTTIYFCQSYTLDGIAYNTTGLYVHNGVNENGCKKVSTLNLTVISDLNVLLTVNNFTLGTTNTYTTYQWLKDGSIITGATSATYTVTANGNYQVVVTNQYGCADTSDVKIITNVGIDEQSRIAERISIYPNPVTKSVIFINSPVMVNAVLASIDGRTLKTVANAKSISTEGLSAGIYSLRILDKEGYSLKVEKIIIQ